MPPKKSRVDVVSTAPPSVPFMIWTDDLVPIAAIEPDGPLPPLEPYDEAQQLAAPKGRQLRELLEEDERLTSAYTGELGRLQAELQRKTKDTTDMVKYLEAEVRRKDLMAKRMSKQLVDLADNHQADRTMMRRQFENTCKYMEKIFLEKEKQIMDKNALLEAQIKALADLQAARATLATELEQTKAVIFSNERTHKLQLDELEKRFLAARDGLQREAAARIATSRATYKLEVGRELEQESTAVRLENEKLRERLRTHEVTSDRLQKLHASLTARILALKQDLELRQQQNEEYLRKSLRQTKAIDEYTKETKVTEDQLITRLRDRQETRVRQDQAHLSALAPLQQSLELVRAQATQVDRANRAWRRRARQALEEKKETERFFLQALEETRENLQRKKQLQKREHSLLQQAQLRELTLPTSLRTKLPFITGNTSHAHTTMNGEQQQAPASYFDSSHSLELGDLTLEDRERVLRLLYAKIAHVPSGLTVALPAHSFDIQLTSGHAHGAAAPPMIGGAAGEHQRPSRRSLPASATSTADPHARLLPPAAEGGGYDDAADQHDEGMPPASSYDETFITNLDLGDDDDEDDGAGGAGDSGEDEVEARMRQVELEARARTTTTKQVRPTSFVDETD